MTGSAICGIKIKEVPDIALLIRAISSIACPIGARLAKLHFVGA
jgi:hypothetical protein